MPSPTQITVAQLSRLIGTPNPPVLIDVITDEDFALAPRLIPTAIRHPHTEIESLVPHLRGKHVVVICQKGRKLSQGAAKLRVHGIHAETLEGGNIAWAEAKGLSIAASRLPKALSFDKPSYWVTRQRPKVDRIACPWLIRRFIDPNAQFLFVNKSEVPAVAELFSAIPFDVDGSEFAHREGECTFDSLLNHFELQSEPLSQLATIVRGADTDQLDMAPQAAGLLAVSLGLSRMYKNDLEQLEQGLLIYDALFRWARDAASESHQHD